MSKQQAIGVFDSGLGGLTVLAELVKAMPNESFIYLGDTARVPYGARSAHIIERYSIEDVEFLLSHKVKMIVIACNTATAYAEQLIVERYQDIPVIGVIEPGVDALLKHTKNKRIGVIGTRSTIKSGAYNQKILARNTNIKIFSRDCPLFVPLVEEGWVDTPITRLVIKQYLSEMLSQQVDTIILGCTHYPLLKSPIHQEFPQFQLIDSSQETAKAVQQLLSVKKLECQQSPDLQKNSKDYRRIEIYLTDLLDKQIDYLKMLLSGTHYDLLEEVQL